MNKKSTSSKKILAIVGVTLFGALLGSSSTYFVYRDDINNSNKTAAKETAANSTAPAKIDNPADENFEDSIPAGTVSPSDIISNFNNYRDKEVKVRGLVVESAENQYILTSSQKNNNGSSIKISAENIKNISDYVSASSIAPKSTDTVENAEKAPKFIKPVTISGKIVLKDQNIQIIASSISE